MRAPLQIALKRTSKVSSWLTTDRGSWCKESPGYRKKFEESKLDKSLTHQESHSGGNHG